MIDIVMSLLTDTVGTLSHIISTSPIIGLLVLFGAVYWGWKLAN